MIEALGLAGAKFASIEFQATAGEAIAVFAESEEINDDFVDTLLGFRSPVSGRVKLLGTDLNAIPEDRRFAVLTEAGVVLKEGGLISNLKVWENILLPVCYHGRSMARAEEAVTATLRRCAFTDDMIAHFMNSVPDVLNLFEKRLAALLRIDLLAARICIYDSLFDDLDAGDASQLARLAASFHRALPERVTLYTTAHAKRVHEFEIQRIVKLTGQDAQ